MCFIRDDTYPSILVNENVDINLSSNVCHTNKLAWKLKHTTFNAIKNLIGSNTVFPPKNRIEFLNYSLV